MEIYLGMKNGCRRAEVLKHFGEILRDADRDRENCCDNCTRAALRIGGSKEDDMLDVTKDAKLLLQSFKVSKIFDFVAFIYPTSYFLS